MSPPARRRRALLLLSLALARGGLAASLVRDRVERVQAQVGRPVPAVVARRDLPGDRDLSPRDLALREVPARFLPPDALAAPEEAIGLRTRAPLAAGSYVTPAVLQGRPGDGGLRRGERALEVAVAGGEALGETGPGARVDVLVSTEPHSGAGRTELALEDVELLALREGTGAASAPGDGGEGAAEAATALATLRVTARQALYLTAAQSFARELRLLVRPPGDRRKAGPAAVSASGL
jgi:pilus assembly protein CpaB